MARDKGMPDGYRTRVTFSDFPVVYFWIKKITPPGYEGGEPIDTTTMDNETYMSKYPKSLIDITNSTLTVTYDPAFYSIAEDMVNVPTFITFEFPDDATVTDYGWVQSFKPNEHSIGEQPTAAVVLAFGNEIFDPDTFTEYGPSYAAP